MPLSLPAATAEQVVAAVEAAIANSGSCTKEFAASFTDMTPDRAEAALELACELKLLSSANATYSVAHPIAQLLRTPQDAEKAAVIRIVIEQFPPFVVFRQELDATGDASAAATRTKAKLDLTPHREDIKVTLLGLATFSGALKAGTGGRYERDALGIPASLKELAAGASENAAAVMQIRETLTAQFANELSTEQIIDPLANALRHASGAAAREAVVFAGNAVESFLTAIAPIHGVNLGNATGINAKLDRFDQANSLPKKLIYVGKYLGHVRNAADHGIDTDVDRAWSVQALTGLNYVYVALAFLVGVHKHYDGVSEI